ncbi:uncharacterized protein LOC124924355 [Impatiens glandulifera]|uniref:uncharacterized protein LOC124924355 n=1 Tax=Impatiens glandulifera TaxID=253017 RepID=UPI001FB0F3AC|nr:uncharacterized protein LOC124924355 [Impatiens glandulifera]
MARNTNKKNPSSLINQCIKKVIDNLGYLGDVGDTEILLLDPILSQCTIQQLIHIEESTKGRDLSEITDEVWKRSYQTDFGVISASLVIERIHENNVSYKWKILYEAKKKDVEDKMRDMEDTQKTCLTIKEFKRLVIE